MAMARPTATTTSCSASRATRTKQTIKKAFRRLARELHPDVSDEPDAEARFREVTEAYEVLSNRRRARCTTATATRASARRLHSRRTSTSAASRPLRGVLWRRPVRRRRGGGARAGRRLGAEIEIELVDAARGTTVEVPFEVAVDCAHCGGDGAEPGTTPCVPTVRRHRAASAGLAQRLRRVRPHAGVPACHGRGVIDRAPVHRLRRRRPRRRARATLEVDVPAGHPRRPAHPVSGEGHAGALGGRAGDVYVLVHVTPRPAVRPRGQRHLHAGRPHDRRRPRSARRSPFETLDGEDRARARRRACNPARSRPAREGDAGAPGLRPWRPARPRERLGARAT